MTSSQAWTIVIIYACIAPLRVYLVFPEPILSVLGGRRTFADAASGTIPAKKLILVPHRSPSMDQFLHVPIPSCFPNC